VKKTLAFLIWPLLAAAAAQTGVVRLPAPPQSDSTAEAIQEITAELAKISGLEQLHPIEYDRISKAKVKAFLEQRVKEEVKPEEIQTEEAALKKLGFAPPDFDLKKTTIDLLTEQAAAFYDFRKKKLFMIDAGSDMIQHSALVHELAHALADQHFHLEKFIDSAKKNDDSSLARLAVMEGQATWLMSEYLTLRTGQSLKDAPVLVEMMARAGEFSAGQFPVFDKAPLYLKATLLFPYTQGMLFQHAVIEKMDKAAFSEVFRNPPVSTQQVLHPAKYFARVKPVRPPLAAFAGHRSYKSYTDGELGELDHSVLLKQYAGEAESAALAPELRGGFFRLLEGKDDRRLVLLYASEWSGPEAARRFFAAYQKVLAGKWKQLEVDSRSDTALGGRGDDGWFRLRLEGARVTSVEGLRSREEAAPPVR
jgi:hypothetical protein